MVEYNHNPELNEIGFDREDDFLIKYANGTVIDEDLSEKTMTHTILEDAHLHNANFDYAAVSGSMFQDCDFWNCSFLQTDLEFCEFKRCIFHLKKDVTSSFNNSTFLQCEFYNFRFFASTFSGAYFEDCVFDHAEIECTTLENAIFWNCQFKNMDLRNLNMDYMEFINPYMENVILPMAQIPYTFGGLQYIGKTSDPITISSAYKQKISSEEYISDVLPLLIKRFTETEEYFPLSNIYLFREDHKYATDSLRKGLATAIAQKDFRMIKYYCRLIAGTQIFSTHALHSFYHQICRLYKIAEQNSIEMHNYIRNIGEIKYILFDRTAKPMLDFSILTNVTSTHMEKISNIIAQLFQFIKMDESSQPNEAEIVLSENSPLILQLHISGVIRNLADLLQVLLRLSGISDKDAENMPMIKTPQNNAYMLTDCFQNKIKKFRQECTRENIRLTIIEYCIENGGYSAPLTDHIYYFNKNINYKERILPCQINTNMN